tara:strand:+ start:163 stop:714 length:552 start_codon:yes stop_codon:yes gene_type:complete
MSDLPTLSIVGGHTVDDASTLCVWIINAHDNTGRSACAFVSGASAIRSGLEPSDLVGDAGFIHGRKDRVRSVIQRSFEQVVRRNGVTRSGAATFEVDEEQTVVTDGISVTIPKMSFTVERVKLAKVEKKSQKPQSTDSPPVTRAAWVKHLLAGGARTRTRASVQRSRDNRAMAIDQARGLAQK